MSVCCMLKCDYDMETNCMIRQATYSLNFARLLLQQQRQSYLQIYSLPRQVALLIYTPCTEYTTLLLGPTYDGVSGFRGGKQAIDSLLTRHSTRHSHSHINNIVCPKRCNYMMQFVLYSPKAAVSTDFEHHSITSIPGIKFSCCC